MKTKTNIIECFKDISNEIFQFQKDVSQELIDTRKEIKELNDYVKWLESTLQAIEIKAVDTSDSEKQGTYHVEDIHNCCTATDFAKEADSLMKWAKDMKE